MRRGLWIFGWRVLRVLVGLPMWAAMSLRDGARAFRRASAETWAERPRHSQAHAAYREIVKGDLTQHPKGEEKPQYRVVVRQRGEDLPLGIEPLGSCAARLKDIRSEMEGTEVEDAWCEKRTVTYGRWERSPGPAPEQHPGQFISEWRDLGEGE